MPLSRPSTKPKVSELSTGKSSLASARPKLGSKLTIHPFIRTHKVLRSRYSITHRALQEEQAEGGTTRTIEEDPHYQRQEISRQRTSIAATTAKTCSKRESMTEAKLTKVASNPFNLKVPK